MVSGGLKKTIMRYDVQLDDTIANGKSAYRVPFPESHPYGAMVDKNHMVWVYEMNSDRVLRFNPFTEQFTEYPFPSLGTDNRFIDIDNSTDAPTLWLPYYRVNKIARMEFRTSGRETAISKR